MTDQPKPPDTAPQAPDYKGFSIRYPRMLRPVRMALVTGLGRSLMWLAGRLTLPGLQRAGRMLGRLVHALSPRQRRLCMMQLATALPELGEEAHRRITAECLRQQGMTLLETLALPRLRAEGDRWVRLEGEDALREAHALGKGVILVTAHTGNWELISVALARAGIKGVAMTSTHANPRINDWLNDLRRTAFIEITNRGSEGSPRLLLSALKAGKALLLACDVDIDTNGVFVDFFGMLANTPRAPASLALKLGTPIMTYFDVREPDGSHTVRFANVPFTEAQKADPDPVRTLTQAINNAIEAHIREFPGQWAWNHRRWKRRPPSESSQGE